MKQVKIAYIDDEIQFRDVITNKLEARYTQNANMTIFEYIMYLRKELNIEVIQ